MKILEKYNIIRARNIQTIEHAKTCYFEPNKFMLVHITKAEALRLESVYSSIVVESYKDSAFLKSRLDHV